MKTVAIPGWGTLEIQHVVVDLNGTLTESGDFIPGVLDDLISLHESGIEVYVLSGDSRGNLQTLLQPFPGIHGRVAETADAKRDFVQSLGPGSTVCIGNGNIDVEMFKIAALSICTIQGEGATVEAIRHAHVAVTRIGQALNLIRDETKLVATLRR